MQIFKRILVPIDFEQKSNNAINVAAQIARKTLSKIDLLHVIEIPLVVKNHVSDHGGKNDAPKSKLASELIEITQKKLEKIKSQYDEQDFEISIRAKTDTIPERVAELITQEDYDLMIIGSDSVQVFYDVVKKTRPERIIELAKCPVLVINEEVELFKTKKVVLPTNLENDITSVIDQIKRFADYFQTDIELLYVNSPGNFKSTEQIQEQYQNFISRHELEGVKFKVYQDHSVKKGIIKYAMTAKADMILLTSRHSYKPKLRNRVFYCVAIG